MSHRPNRSEFLELKGCASCGAVPADWNEASRGEVERVAEYNEQGQLRDVRLVYICGDCLKKGKKF
jgi:hypothetical protein